MPRRTSLRDRVNATPPLRGREAIYGEPDPAANADAEDTLAGTLGPPTSGPRWEAVHKRVTFYCSMALLDAIEAEMARTDRTKTQVIADALAEHLRAAGGRTRISRPGARRG